MMRINNLFNSSKRVDVQVSVLSAVLVVCSCICIYAFHYRTTYQSMIDSLVGRAEAVYGYIDKSLSKEAFTVINQAEDMEKQEYMEVKISLEEIRNAADIRYLYTAKKSQQGLYIYQVDGLANNSEDFRKPGDAIEVENIPDIEKAYEGQIVLPKKILNTSWGKIFLAYYPIHENTNGTGDVIGVLGMEFDAEQEYNTYRNLKIFTPIIIIFMCILASIIARSRFRRISNPKNQDLYNTDQLTKLKNRNAFEYDTVNLAVSRQLEKLGIIIFDLDYLKKVNDTHGHAVGDQYIRGSAEAIEKSLGEDSWAYRIGGDEFAVLMKNADETKMEIWVEDFRKRFGEIVKPVISEGSISVGWAVFDEDSDEDAFTIYERADASMYKNKDRRKTG